MQEHSSRQEVHRNYLDTHITFNDFINQEVVLYSVYSTQRAIPCVVDGLKPSQRKVLYYVLKHNQRSEIKVTELTGVVSKETAYHHGDTSLGDTIVKMAQNFVGANNINFLEPCGQFGSRGQNGSDNASHRYIWTKVHSLARKVFIGNDDRVLSYQEDEGVAIEPKWFCPIIPMVLVNGQSGIGTGWSTTIPNYNPLDIIDNVRLQLSGQKQKSLIPWYRGFRGSITRKGKGIFKVSGIAKNVSSNKVEITEIPLGMSVDKCVDSIKQAVLNKKPKKNGFSIRGFEFGKKHSNDNIRIIVRVSNDGSKGDDAAEQLIKELKLTSNIRLTNMILWDANGSIKKYESELEVINDFCKVRLDLYHKRRLKDLAELRYQAERLSDEVKFVELLLSGELDPRGISANKLVKQLHQHGLRPLSKLKAVREQAGIESSEPHVSTNQDLGVQSIAGDFQYLLGKTILEQTKEAVASLCKKEESMQSQLAELEGTTAEDLWLKDLEVLEQELLKSGEYERLTNE